MWTTQVEQLASSRIAACPTTQAVTSSREAEKHLGMTMLLIVSAGFSRAAQEANNLGNYNVI